MPEGMNRIIPKNTKGTFWLSFLLCFCGCLFIIFVIAPLTGVSKKFGEGHDGYIQLAENLGRGNGYVFEKGGPAVFHRPPLYPLLLVPIMLLPDFLQRPALILMQSLMVGCMGALIFEIARRLFNFVTAQVAVVLFLLNPWVYWNAKNPMTGILQALLYMTFAVLAGREVLAIVGRLGLPAGKMGLWWRRVAVGITGAALALTHGAMLAVDIAFLFVLFIAGISRRNYQVVRTSVIAAVIMVALIAPWTYRNWVVFHRFIPIVGGGGLGYFNGNVHWVGIAPEPQRKGESYIDASLRVVGIEGTEETHTHWKGLKDVELEDKVNKKMVEHMRAHPGAFMKKLLLNSVEYYFPIITYPFLAVKIFGVENLALSVFHLVLWGLAFIGIWRGRGGKESKLGTGIMLCSIVLYGIWYLPFVTFIGHSLYTLGTIPFLSILAARGFETTTRAGIRTCGAN